MKTVLGKAKLYESALALQEYADGKCLTVGGSKSNLPTILVGTFDEWKAMSNNDGTWSAGREIMDEIANKLAPAIQSMFTKFAAEMIEQRRLDAIEEAKEILVELGGGDENG